MADDAQPELIPRLYDKLQDRLRAHDKDGAIEAYCQLFLAGRPLDEIIVKGAFNHADNGSDQIDPDEGAPEKQVAPARNGQVVSEDTPAANPDSLTAGSDITSGAEAVEEASGPSIDEQLWFVRHRRWAMGVPIAALALVTPVMFVNDAHLEKVSVAIQTAADTVRFAIGPASTAPAAPRPMAAGPTAQSDTTSPSPPANASGQTPTSAVEVEPAPPIATTAEPKVVAVGAGQDKPNMSPPSDASSQTPAAAVEAAPTPPIAATAEPKVVRVGAGQDQPSTSPPTDASRRAPAAPVEVTRVSPVAAVPFLKVVTAGEARSQLNATALAPPAASSDGLPGRTAVEAAPHPPVTEGAAAVAVAPKIAAAAQSVRGEPDQSELETETLVSRGDALLGIGDLTAARLFYRRGADLGDSTAALRLGETFDPAFLQQAGLGRIAGDLKSALYWYQWAHALGNGDADLLTKGLIPIGSNKQ